MALYQYYAITDSGKTLKGVVEAEHEKEAEELLYKRKIILTKLELYKEVSKTKLSKKEVLNFTLELQELTDTDTKEKRYVASIEFGSTGQWIPLPSENYRQAYQKIERKIKDKHYILHVSPDGSIGIKFL